MSAPPGRNARLPGPGPGIFKLTPNKFSKAPAPPVINQPAPRIDRRSARQSASSSRVDSITAANTKPAKRAAIQQTIQPAPRPDPATRFKLTPCPIKEVPIQPSKRARPAQAAPVPRPVSEKRVKLTPRPTKPPAAQPTLPRSASLLKQATTQAASQAKASQPLHSLSVDEFCDLAAHSTSAQIAEQYGIKISTVYSHLSKVVRRKADEEGRTIDNVKDELNQKRVANGAIPAIDGRYGVRTLPPRARAGGGYMQAPVRGSGMIDESDEDEVMGDGDEIQVSLSHTGVTLAAKPSAGPGNEVDLQEDLDDGEGGADDPSLFEVDRQNAASEIEIAGLLATDQRDKQTALPDHLEDHLMDDLEGPIDDVSARELAGESRRYERVEMPNEVLFNNEASRLWMLGYRAQAVLKAEDTKEYMQDFVLKPEDLD